MTRIILTVGCVGKTYLDKTYSNVYDFDKHTLEYKYDKTGFEHLSNEEFKRDDMMSLITSFSGKLYGLRSKKKQEKHNG